MSLETWAVIALIAMIGILMALRTLAVHLGHSLQLEALKRKAQHLRDDQNRRLEALLRGDDEEEVFEVDVIDDPSPSDAGKVMEATVMTELPLSGEEATNDEPAEPMASAA